MKYYLIKITFCICIVFFVNACHTFEHQNIFTQNINKVSNEKLLEKENEMAPIEIPKQTEYVKKLALQKKVKIPNNDKFNFKRLLNWNEEKLIKTLGKGHFIKEEGKLKNHQYHFKECLIDIFLLKKNSVYIVNYIEKRPKKLNGTINIEACFEEVKQILN